MATVGMYLSTGVLASLGMIGLFTIVDCSSEALAGAFWSRDSRLLCIQIGFLALSLVAVIAGLDEGWVLLSWVIVCIIFSGAAGLLFGGILADFFIAKEPEKESPKKS